jgi:feruloyl esterase
MNARFSLRLVYCLSVVCGVCIWTQSSESTLKPLYAQAAPACGCEELLKFSFPNTTIESAAVDSSDGSCRVTAVVTHPPANDRVKVFIGLPTKDWNGRFRGTGGGGFFGGGPGNLPGPVKQGFATGATDTGHEGGSGSFALDSNNRLNWQSIIDNAYLGIHEMSVVGKAITEKFYGKPPRYSYFTGASTGGRQGLMEAQRFPEDYNGIFSGCPAANWHRFVPADIWPEVVMAAANNFVSKAKLDAATAAAIAACDDKDGVKDGVIDDPFHCAYDPKALVGAKVGDSTFTDADADVLRKIWEGPRGPGGNFLWYGMERGADLSALAGTGGTPLTGKPFSIAFDYVRFYLAQDANLDWQTITPARFEQLWNQSVEEFGNVIGTDDPDLTRFHEHGGKLLILHGLADQLIPAMGSVDYYKRVQEKMGGAKKTAQFARLFLIPGVDHGFRGPGPGPIGYFEALMRWVEEGKAPEQLTGERRDGSGKVLGKRPLFPYPEYAKYKGSGSTEDPANFVKATAKAP